MCGGITALGAFLVADIYDYPVVQGLRSHAVLGYGRWVGVRDIKMAILMSDTMEAIGYINMNGQ